MNPVIICGTPNNGVIEVPLNTACNCYIGLVSITLPAITKLNDNMREIYVSCDQLDATVTNRKRLLRVFGYNKKPSRQWSEFKFINVMYYKIDSSERKLTIRLYDSNGPIIPSADKTNSQNIIVVLNMIPAKTLAKTINSGGLA